MYGTRAVRLLETENLDGHMKVLRETVEESLTDPELSRLAVRIVSGSYDWVEDPRTGRRIPIVEGWGKRFHAPQLEVCGPKDDSCELGFLWTFVVENCRYVYDMDMADLFKTARISLIDGGGDCFPEGTLLLTSDYRLTPIEHLRAGQRIWGRDRWSEVGAVVPKGERAITSIRLNNGSWLRLTGDHKVYVAECPRHPRNRKSGPCYCTIAEREVLRIAVDELEPGMVLVQPDAIETVSTSLSNCDPNMAWLDGAYLAEGWVDGKNADAPCRFSISGRDGKPKEATKHRVQAMMAAAGISTRWHERYIAVNDATLAQRYASFGKGAANKRLPSLEYSGPALQALFDGLMLDASKNTHGGGHTFGSVSHQLAVQVRTIARMLGLRTGWATVENHGGLGKQPIHRVTIPHPERGVQKLLRVKEILTVEGDERMTWDLKTDDHYVYLPEHDVTVSNCDDSTIVFISLARAIGFSHAVARVISTDAEGWEHVYPIIACPKDRPDVWIPLDATVEGVEPGWQAPFAAFRDFAM